MPSGENRLAGRQRTFLGAKIVYHDAATVILCTIRNRSEDGARIEVAASQSVPRRFYLLIPKDKLAYEAEYVWRSGSQVGVRLLGAIDLNSPDLPRAHVLRDLLEK